MPYRDLRPVAESLFSRFVGEVAEKLDDRTLDRSEVCRDAIAQLYGVTLDPAMLEDESLPLGVRAQWASFDPRNITLEPEYYADVDPDRYARVKPLHWLWQSFDRSPLGGGNVHLGVRFRRILAPHLFARCGRNFKAFQFVEFSYGYNMEVGDDCVVHRHVLLDDRGGITLGNRVSISDYANVYSHTHSIVDQKDVTNARTVLEDDVRITYHATVLAGVRVGRNAMVGAVAVATKNVRAYHVNVGIPAKSIRVKPDAPPEAYVTERVVQHHTTER